MGLYWPAAAAVLVALVLYAFYTIHSSNAQRKIGQRITNGTRAMLLRNGFYENGSGVYMGNPGSEFGPLGTRFTLSDASEYVTTSLMSAITASSDVQ